MIEDPSITEVSLHLFGQVCKEVCIQFDDSYTFTLKGKATKKAAIVVNDKSKKLTEKLKLNLKKHSTY